MSISDKRTYFRRVIERYHEPVAAISQSLDHAYAHHIQPLMITGNFASLAGVQSDAVDTWSDYGIADPSTLIATVKDRVEIRYRVRLNR
jgi:hypothetical protein